MKHVGWICGLFVLTLMPYAMAQTNTVTDKCPPKCATNWASEAVVQEVDADTDRLFVDELLADIEVLEQRLAAFAADDTRRIMVEALARAVDPKARIISDEDADALQQRREGYVYALDIGFDLTNGVLLVTDVGADSPVAVAGLKPGDRIQDFDDETVTNLYATEVYDKIEGPAAETVHLVVLTADGQTNEMDVGRSLVSLPDIEHVEVLPNELGYIRLNGLYAGTGHRVAEVLETFAARPVFGTVLDVREAGGEDLESIRRIAGLFTQPNDLLFELSDARGDSSMVASAPDSGRISCPLMILTDPLTHGAAEMLVAVCKGSVRGVMILGCPTEGDFLVRELIELPSGDALYAAVKQFTVADGTIYRGINGIKPDICVNPDQPPEILLEPDWEEKEPLPDEIADWNLRKRVQRDPALRRATDLLLGLKALNLGSRSHDAED